MFSQAKQFHPDVNKDPGAKEKFSEVFSHACVMHMQHFD
jgi:DnaJ-class molecular chaperone